MDQDTEPARPEITFRIPADLFYQIGHELRRALPPPVTDTPEDRIRRDNSMIACVAALLPATAEEAMLAVQCVAANAQAIDCLRLARRYPDDIDHVTKCTAQAGNMMRNGRSAQAHLRQLQAARRTRDADTTARDNAVAAEQAAITAFRDALATAPPESVETPDDLTEAEQYALAHPSKAALIRNLGRLPKKFDGAPLPPSVLHDIVHSGSPILQALLKKSPHRLARAA